MNETNEKVTCDFCCEVIEKNDVIEFQGKSCAGIAMMTTMPIAKPVTESSITRMHTTRMIHQIILTAKAATTV